LFLHSSEIRPIPQNLQEQHAHYMKPSTPSISNAHFKETDSQEIPELKHQLYALFPIVFDDQEINQGNFDFCDMSLKVHQMKLKSRVFC
jgi:hypothetical protein